MTGWFLFPAAFLPRTTLLLCWLFGAMPINSTPLTVDVLAAIIAPRLLIAWWLYDGGFHPVLIGVFVLLEVVSKFGTLRRAVVRREEGE